MRLRSRSLSVQDLPYVINNSLNYKKVHCMSKTIGTITGSLRRNSFSSSIVDYVKINATAAIRLNGLPLYNQEFDGEELK